MQAVSVYKMCVNYITFLISAEKDKTLRYPQSMEAKRKIMISVPSV